MLRDIALATIDWHGTAGRSLCCYCRGVASLHTREMPWKLTTGCSNYQ